MRIDGSGNASVTVPTSWIPISNAWTRVLHAEAYNHRINTQRGATRVVQGARTGFHFYRFDWTPDAIHGYIDGQLVLDFPNVGSGHQARSFDKPLHLLLNLAVGGDWSGKEGADYRIFPVAMQIDYIRVYRMVGAA